MAAHAERVKKASRLMEEADIDVLLLGAIAGQRGHRRGQLRAVSGRIRGAG
jgi:hypothetical protein